jgi:uncharacterized protein (TIGR03085 family)
MTSLAHAERAALCDLFAAVGPDAPTLSGAWTTRQLAAHLVVREGSPSAVGIVVGPLRGWTERAMRSAADRPWPGLVAAVRSGPPLWSPLRIGRVDDAANTFEFFVHHEDVRRASEPWSPRPLDPERERVLWSTLRSRAKLLFARSPVTVELRTPAGDQLPAKAGGDGVVLTGPASELVLYAHGRRDHALVEISGSTTARASFDRANLSV